MTLRSYLSRRLKFMGGKLFLKFLATSLITLVVIGVGIAFLLLISQKEAYEKEMETRWVDQASLTAGVLANAITLSDYAFLDENSQLLQEKFDDVLDCAVFNRSLVCIGREGPTDRKPTSLVTRCLEDGRLLLEYRSEREAGDRVADIAAPIVVGDKVWGVLYVTYSAARLDQMIAPLYSKLSALGILFLVLTVAASMFLARHIAGPVAKLARAAGAVSQGDLDVRCSLARRDELGTLAGSFDLMLANLRRTRDQLEGSRAYVESILSSMVDSLVVVEWDRSAGDDPRIVNANRAALEMLRYASESELIGLPADVLLGSGRTVALLGRIIEEGELRNVELEYRRRDERPVQVRFSASTLVRYETGVTDPDATHPRFPGEGVQSFVFVASDVSKLRKAERIRTATYEVAESVHQADTIQSLFGHVHEALKGLMPAENFSIALRDPRSGEMSYPYRVDEHESRGVRPRPISGLTEYVLVTEKPLLASTQTIRDLVEPELEEQGTPMPVEWLGVPLRSTDRLIGVMEVRSYEAGVRYSEEDRNLLVFISDQVGLAIHRKRDEEERHRLSLAVKHAADAVIITDPKGSFQYVNPAFSRMSGYSSEEILGMGPGLLLGELTRFRVVREVWTGIRGGGSWSGRMLNNRKDGSEYEVEAAISSVKNEAGQVVNYVCVQHDISHEVALEEQLRQSQKMEAVGKLAGGIAHDFNNLLSVITGYGDMLIKDLADDIDESALTQLQQIRRAGDRAASLTRQLLAFSRRQILKPQVLLLNSVVSDVEKMLRRLIGEDVELSTALDSGLGMVKADPGQMEQVIMNLAVNARDAMPDGGKLTLETANVALSPKPHGGVPTVAPGPYVMLAVSDTGCGMDGQTQARIFEPFYTTKEVGKGTGLGLSTVYGIIRQSGGHLSVYSEVGYGTTFKVYLPRHGVGAKGEYEDDSSEITIPGGTETVLLVEDEVGVRNLARDFLQRSGYNVLVAEHGVEALAQATAYSATIHLLLTDVIMPLLGGQDLARQLTHSRPDLKVLFMTGYTDVAIKRHGVLEPGTQLLEKPFTERELARKVREILDSRVADTSSLTGAG